MSRPWEKIIEDAVVSVIGANTNLVSAGIPCRKWADGSKDEVYPVVLAHCGPVAPATEASTDQIIEAIVEVGARSHKKKNTDENGDKCKQYLGYVRDTIFGATFKTSMNSAMSGLILISFDLNSGQSDGDFDNINQSNQTLNLFLQTT
jgi:hypothetical protein